MDDAGITRVVFVDHDGDVMRLWRKPGSDTVVVSATQVHIPLSEVADVMARIVEFAT